MVTFINSILKTCEISIINATLAHPCYKRGRVELASIG